MKVKYNNNNNIAKKSDHVTFRLYSPQSLLDLVEIERKLREAKAERERLLKERVSYWPDTTTTILIIVSLKTYKTVKYMKNWPLDIISVKELTRDLCLFVLIISFQQNHTHFHADSCLQLWFGCIWSRLILDQLLDQLRDFSCSSSINNIYLCIYSFNRYFHPKSHRKIVWSRFRRFDLIVIIWDIRNNCAV